MKFGLLNRRARLLMLLVLFSACLMSWSSSMAVAAPQAPTMGLAELEERLGTGPASGYFETVIRGDTIAQVPVEILAVTGGATNSFILFEASGPIIGRLGGIAAGMSGSPVYIEDGGTDKLVGAVSYGDYYTLGGTGLATPIEAMVNIEESFTPGVHPLDVPVLAGSSVIRNVLVVPNPEDYEGAAAQGSFVAEPLTSVFLGGLKAQSRMYKRLETALAREGVRLVPLAAPLGGTALKNGLPYYADFEPGGSLGVLGSRGDLWMGGIGTVTYTSDDVVLGFGHPAFWDGPSNLYMTNAWIDGLWPSQLQPYKIGRPGAVHGAITQDRAAGVMGLDNKVLAETPVTARATDSNTGRTATSEAFMPTEFLAVNDGRSAVAAAGAYVAAEKLFDQSVATGSVVTTTTVVVSDGADEHTVELKNVYDSGVDIAYESTADVFRVLNELMSITEGGLANPRIVSIDLESAFSSARHNAELADISAPRGLRAGIHNPVTVSVLKHGVAAPETINATLFIPRGTVIEGGRLVASAAAEAPPSDEDGGTSGQAAGGLFDRRSVKDVVDALNSAPGNDVMSIRFYPGTAIDEDGFPVGDPGLTEAAAEKLLGTGSMLFGEVEKAATRPTLGVSPSTIAYGGTTLVQGELHGAEKTGTIRLYGKAVGESTERLLKTTRTTSDGGWFSYRVTLTGLKKNTALRVVYEGDDSTLASEATGRVTVRAKVTLKTSATRVRSGARLKLTANVTPATTTGSTVVFEYYSERLGKWRKIASKTLVAAPGATSANASHSWAPPAKVKVRVRFLGCATNASGSSATKTIYVK